MRLKQVLLLFSFIYSVTSQAGYIDNHVHVACLGYQSNCYIADSLKNSYKFTIYQKMFGFKESEAKQMGDAIIFERLHKQVKESKLVDQVVVLALDQVYLANGDVDKKNTQIYVPNDFVSDNVKRYETFLFGASVHPYRKDALQALTEVKTEGAVLVKLIPSIQNFDPSDKRLTPYYKKLKELGLPLLIHMDDENSFAHDAKEFSGPLKLKLALDQGVTVICAHAASNGNSTTEGSYYESLTQMLSQYPHLYADVSGLLIFKTRFAHIQKVIQDPRWKDRLIYGSDWPLSHTLLSSPLYYVFQLGFIKSFQLAQVDNLWDRDVLVKKAFGLENEVFKKTRKILLPNPDSHFSSIGEEM